MTEAYQGFFAASATASAAFIGLLFVSLAFIESEKVAEKVKAWRRIIASSAFSQLINIFFVSLIALTPDPRNLFVASSFLAVLGLFVSLRLLPPTIRTENTGRDRPSILGIVTVGVYILQFIISLSLLHNPNKTIFSYFILLIILLYAGALARAWEITGIRG